MHSNYSPSLLSLRLARWEQSTSTLRLGRLTTFMPGLSANTQKQAQRLVTCSAGTLHRHLLRSGRPLSFHVPQEASGALRVGLRVNRRPPRKI